MEVGEEVLADLGVEPSRVLPVFNKMDRCEGDTGAVGDRLVVSAKTGEGVDGLKIHLLELLAAGAQP